MDTAPSDLPEPDDQEICEYLIAVEELRYDDWLDYSQPFDLTGESYAHPDDPPTELAQELRDAIATGRPGRKAAILLGIEEAILLDQGRMAESKAAIIVSRSDLEWMEGFDLACHQNPDAALRKAADAGPVELLAAGRLIHDRDPTFWSRLRKLGATPAMVAEANRILRGADHHHDQHLSPVATAGAYQRRTCSRVRSSRRAAPGRRQGSRRATSRAGPSDDDGESEPPRRQPGRHPHRVGPSRIGGSSRVAADLRDPLAGPGAGS